MSRFEFNINIPSFLIKALFLMDFLCMQWQLAELNSDGFEVILVSSGAVGLGRQRLRYRQLVNSRFFCDGNISQVCFMCVVCLRGI